MRELRKISFGTNYYLQSIADNSTVVIEIFYVNQHQFATYNFSELWEMGDCNSLVKHLPYSSIIAIATVIIVQ